MSNPKPLFRACYAFAAPTRAQRCHDMRLKTIKHPKTGRYMRRPTSLREWTAYALLTL